MESANRTPALFEAIVTSISDTVLLADDSGALTYVCPNVDRIFGYSADEVVQMGNVSQLFGDTLFEPDKLALAGEITNIERDLNDKEGRTHRVLVTVKKVSIGDGSILYTCRDITDRRHLEQRMDLYERIISATSDSIALVDTDYVYRAVNDTYLKRTGKTREEILNHSVSEVLGEEQFERIVKSHLDRSLSGEEVRYQDWFEFFEVGRRYLHVTYTPFYDDSGVLTGAVVNARDITEMKSAHQRTEESELRLHTLVENAPVGVYMTDTDGACVYTNPAWCQTAGIKPQEAHARGWTQAIHPEDRERVTNEWLQTLQERKGWDQQYRFLQPDGHVRWVRAFANPLFDREGSFRGYIGTNVDITAHVELLSRLERSNQLVDAVRKSQALYIEDAGPGHVFHSLLDTIVSVTDSEFGFLDEVCYEPDGTPYKLSLALSNIGWDDASSQLYEELIARNLEFRNMNNLAGVPVKTGKLVISNEPDRDPRSGGLPAGHPKISCLLAVPLYHAGELVGVAGIANRPDGYSEELATFLEPFFATCGSIIHSQKSREKQKEYLARNQELAKRFEAMQATSLDGFWLVGHDGSLREVNAAYCAMSGYTRDELLGMRIHDIEARESEGEVDAHIRALLKEGYARFESAHVKRDGQTFEVEVTATALPGRGEIVAFLRDVTEVRRAHSMLRESEARLSESNQILGGCFSIHISWPSTWTLPSTSFGRTAPMLRRAVAIRNS